MEKIEKMTVEDLRKSNRIIYEVIAGSYSYGTYMPGVSDKDIRGYFWTPKDSYVSLFPVQDQVNDEKNDIVYYDLRRAFDLLKTANPNQAELLWIPQDCILQSKNPLMQVFLENRKLFISKKAYYSHAEYAYMQIKKAKGKNKKVHNPQTSEVPKKEKFCWVIDMKSGHNYPKEILEDLLEVGVFHPKDIDPSFPFRPVPLTETNIDLKHIHVSSLEHAPNVFRMYYYGEGAKGVFRGDQMLCCESIPKEDEKLKFRGLLIYNQNEFEKALKEWNSYWDWKKKSNQHRWTSQEGGRIDYDVKNMMHCVRLMMSSEHILRYGEPLVRMEGEMRERLMNIRHGKFTYEEIMEDVDRREILLKELLVSSKIPEEVDMDSLNKLYKKLMDIGEEMFRKSL